MMTLPKRPNRIALLPAILLLVVFPITIAVGAIGYIAVNWLEQEAEERMREDIELIARALQQPLNQAIRTGEPILLQQSLRSAFSFGRVYGAHIYGPDGDLLAGAGAGVRRFTNEREEALDRLDARGEGYAAMGDEPTHVYFLPLTTQGGRIAAILQLTRHPDELRETLSHIRIAGSAGLGGIALLLSLIVVVGHRRAIGGPLADLSTGMRRVEHGQLDYRLQPVGPSEIRALGNGFNAMLDQIQQAAEEIAERREDQAQLQVDLQASRKLAAVGELSAGVAHQLGTPLGVLDGRAQSLLRRKDLDDSTRQGLAGIREEVSRMSRTVRQLMDFSRSRPLQRRSTQLSAIVSSAVERTQSDPAALNTSIKLTDHAPAVRLLVDGPRLEEALCNLLKNAVQAASGGEVWVHTQITDETYSVFVEDNGPGIPEAERPRLFEPFHTTKAVGDGTGLGLAVAHGIARSHGGSLALCHNATLPGACFELTLPRKETELPE